MRTLGGDRGRSVPIRVIGDKGIGRRRGPPGTERVKIGGVGAFGEEPAGCREGLVEVKVIGRDWEGV